MSLEVNTVLFERAAELADSIDNPYYCQQIEVLVREGELEELFQLVKIMEAIKDTDGRKKQNDSF